MELVGHNAEKKGTGQLVSEPIDGTCSGVLVYAATNTVDLFPSSAVLTIHAQFLGDATA